MMLQLELLSTKLHWKKEVNEQLLLHLATGGNRLVPDVEQLRKEIQYLQQSLSDAAVKPPSTYLFI